MDAGLREAAVKVREAMPCSIALPAGTGKTEVIAALTAIGRERGERVLVLTHTNAGVEALRRRLRRFGVDDAAARVETIASWSFGLVGRYPKLAGLSVGELPNWSLCDKYYAGAAAATRAIALREVMAASFAFVVVDEYQDCVVEQHDLVQAIHRVLPVCVFGDPLQNIFNFGSNKTIRWSTDVTPLWPALELPTVPWRWIGHNDALGRWLLNIREHFYAGTPIDLLNAPVTWVQNTGRSSAINACFARAGATGSVVAIGEWANNCATAASQLNGTYAMMEEIQGNFMLKFAGIIDGNSPAVVARGTLEFAKDCAIGVAGILDSYVAKRLSDGCTVAHLERPGAQEQLASLSKLLVDPSATQVHNALLSLGRLSGIRFYRREAWRDMLRALSLAALNDQMPVTETVTRIRNQGRYAGRPKDRRVVSRPLLIKGLEYDHAVLLNADEHKPCNLYVALTRGRKSLSIVSRERYLRPQSVDA